MPVIKLQLQDYRMNVFLLSGYRFIKLDALVSLARILVYIAGLQM